MVFGIFVILIPLAIYLIAGMVAKKDIKNPDDFYIAYKKVGTTPFANSSIAYGFQVATVYPFIIWAATGSISLALANSFFWGVGILIFSLVIPKLSEFIGTDKTLHGFLGEKYKSTGLRITTSYLTFIGIAGVALAEIVWGSSLLSILIGDSKIAMYLVLFFMIFYVLLYILRGGQLSSIRTDQIQLIFSYIGIFVIIGYSIFVLIKNSVTLNFSASFSLIILFFSLAGILFYRKFRFLKPETSKSKTTTIMKLTNIFISGLFIIVICLALFSLPKLNFAGAEDSLSIANSGIMMLIALILMPLLAQFCDMTNWQRILAVEIGDKTNKKEVINNITKGLRVYGFESPFSWFSVIALGALVALAFPSVIANGDPFYNIPNLLVSSAIWYEQLFGYAFIVSILAIMLSTVDSAIAAIMFTFTYDSFPFSREILDSKDNDKIEKNTRGILAIGKLVTVLLILFLLLYVFIDSYGFGGYKFIGMLFAFYTAQLSFAIPVIGAILLKSLPRKGFVIVSIITSAAFGVLSGVLVTIKNLESLQWVPIIGTIVISLIVYSIGLLGAKNNE